METQPPEDPSALVRKVAELQGEISDMKTELNEIKRLLRDKGHRDSLSNNVLHGMYYEIHKSRPSPQEKIKPMQHIEISGGESLRLPDNRWLHRCGKCACTWLSSNNSPGACVRHRADKKGPRCGTTRWREIHDEYWENAAAMHKLNA